MGTGVDDISEVPAMTTLCRVAPLCVLHGLMGTLVYRRETFRHFSMRRLQLGVGSSKGHKGKGDVRRSRLVHGTQEHGPLVLMVNHIARGLVPEWFTWTTIELSCYEMTYLHQHRFDSTAWSAVFSTRQHLGGEISVEEGGVGSGPRGIPQTALTVQAIGTVSIGNL